MTYLLLIVWFIFLIKWADMLVDWAWSIAKKFGISSLVIWLTVVAFGTSAPEFVVSFISTLNWKTDLAIANVVWSNIVNIALILWITALIYPIKMPSSTIKKEIPFAIIVSFLLLLLVNDIIFWTWNTNSLWMIDWIILLLFFIWFLYYTFTISKNKSSNEENTEIKNNTKIKSIILIIIWLTWLIIWWKLIVDNAIIIATSFWLSRAFIWVTIVAIWTSLPELASSIVAALKKNTDMAIWAIIWSNIFNILWILWFSALFNNLVWYKTLNIDLIVWSFLTVLLIIFAFMHRKHFLEKKEWIILLLVYIWYMSYLIYNL